MILSRPSGYGEVPLGVECAWPPVADVTGTQRAETGAQPQPATLASSPSRRLFRVLPSSSPY
jgi:hypothetical protein